MKDELTRRQQEKREGLLDSCATAAGCKRRIITVGDGINVDSLDERACLSTTDQLTGVVLRDISASF